MNKRGPKIGSNHWSATEKNFLVVNYGHMSANEIASVLGRSYGAVQGQLHRMGLSNGTRRIGSNNGCFRTGLSDTNAGYVKNNVTRKLRHREVVEQRDGRELDPKEVVHHLDGNKKNNSPDNLLLCSDKSEHRHVHAQLERLSFQLVRSGAIQFNSDTKQYELASDPHK
jgi:hypothetical protein